MRLAPFDHAALGHRLRRLARAELNRLLRTLDTGALDEAAVHRMRRSTKRIAAMADLVRASGGPGLSRTRKDMRQVRRSLSTLRDLDVMVDTLDAVAPLVPDAMPASGHRTLRRRLRAQRRRRTTAMSRARLVDTLVTLVRRAQRDVSRWKVHGSGVDALASGLRRTHRRCRRAFIATQTAGSDEAWHTWRKRLSALRIQLSLIRRRDLAQLAAKPALDAAATALGDGRNLALLDEWLHAEAGRLPPGVDLARIATLIERRGRALRTKAVRLAGPACRMTTMRYIAAIAARHT